MFWLQYIAINRLHAFDYTQMVGIYYSCFFLNLSRTYVVFDQSYVVLFWYWKQSGVKSPKGELYIFLIHVVSFCTWQVWKWQYRLEEFEQSVCLFVFILYVSKPHYQFLSLC